VTVLIGFAGLKRSGKDTAAEALIRQGYHREAFADLVRGMLREFGLTEQELTEGKDKPIPWLPGKTPRDLLLSLGTAWGRKRVDENIWPTLMARRLDRLPADTPVVITDVRFENEADMIRARGGLIIHVQRETEPVWKRLWRRLTAHPSERGVKFKVGDHLVINSASKEDLWGWVNSIMMYERAKASGDIDQFIPQPHNLLRTTMKSEGKTHV